MSKYLFLAILNIKLVVVALLLLVWFLITSNEPGLTSVPNNLLIFTWFGGWAMYQLFLARHIFIARKSKQKFDLPRFSLLTIAPFLFQALFLVGWFFASDFFVVIGLVLLSLVLFLVARQSSPRFAIGFTGLALCLILISSFLGFKDSYCWKASAALGDKMVDPTTEEIALLNKEGFYFESQVNQVLIARLKCHQDFSLANIINH